MSDINGDRLLADLRTLAAIGGLPDGGVDRLAWSDHDLAGRRWFAERMGEAGIEPRVDAALNVFGHMPGAAGPWLLTGSHLDSVPNGGRLDGAYGAVAALEVLRTLLETRDPLAEPTLQDQPAHRARHVRDPGLGDRLPHARHRGK